MAQQNITNSPNPSIWTSYTSTITATTTNPTLGSGFVLTSSYLQNGKSLNVALTFYQLNPGTAGSGNYLFSLPSGFTINNSIVPFYPGGAVTTWVPQCGTATLGGTSLQTMGVVVPYNATNVGLSIYGPGTPILFMLAGSTAYALNNGTIFYNFYATIPIN